MSEQLGECKLFVQLLSRSSASFLASDPTGGIRVQFEAAIARKLPVLQWFHDNVEIERVANPQYRAFLEEHKGDVSPARDMQALAQEIVGQLARIRNESEVDPPVQPRKQRCIGINWDIKDEPLAKELERKIKEACPDGSVLPVLPSTEIDWKERKEVYEECDAMIVVWGAAKTKWVFRQIRNVFPELWPADTHKAKALADFTKPPPPAQKLGFDPMEAQSVEVLDFTSGLDTKSLRNFCKRS